MIAGGSAEERTPKCPPSRSTWRKTLLQTGTHCPRRRVINGTAINSALNGPGPFYLSTQIGS